MPTASHKKLDWFEGLELKWQRVEANAAWAVAPKFHHAGAYRYYRKVEVRGTTGINSIHPLSLGKVCYTQTIWTHITNTSVFSQRGCVHCWLQIFMWNWKYEAGLLCLDCCYFKSCSTIKHHILSIDVVARRCFKGLMWATFYEANFIDKQLQNHGK